MVAFHSVYRTVAVYSAYRTLAVYSVYRTLAVYFVYRTVAVAVYSVYPTVGRPSRTRARLAGNVMS